MTRSSRKAHRRRSASAATSGAATAGGGTSAATAVREPSRMFQAASRAWAAEDAWEPKPWEAAAASGLRPPFAGDVGPDGPYPRRPGGGVDWPVDWAGYHDPSHPRYRCHHMTQETLGRVESFMGERIRLTPDDARDLDCLDWRVPNRMMPGRLAEYFNHIYEPAGRAFGPYVSSSFIGIASRAGFFDSPASTKFHLFEHGGLAVHSMGVALAMSQLERGEVRDMDGNSWEGAVASALGEDAAAWAPFMGMWHDACKSGAYEANDDPNPAKPPFKFNGYAVRDNKSDHGEASVDLVRTWWLLSTDPDAQRIPEPVLEAIDWHMGGFDHRIQKGFRPSPEEITANEEAFRRMHADKPLVLMLHAADMLSSKAYEM